MTLHVSAGFDSGNIEILSAEDPGDIRLEIRKDAHSDFYQWFHFRLTGAKDTPVRLRIVNAGGAAYPKGYDDYRAVASHDRESWERVPTSYGDGVLTIEHTPAADAVWYAYFAPYTMERHADLIARVQQAPGVAVEVLGETLDGQTMDLVTVGSPGGEPGAGRVPVWIVARQHPGESMAEWWMEGFLDRLLDPDDRAALALRERAVVHLVPNMNPDGARRGHLRTNAAGANLNREWAEPTMEKSPEVYVVRARMEETGCAFGLDVHGDEALPYNFIAGMMGIPSLTDAQVAAQKAFADALLAGGPDFQTVHGYPAARPGKANLTMCANWVAERFGCPAVTLEMPFKDNADNPDDRFGWSPARTRAFAATHIEAITAALDAMRG